MRTSWTLALLAGCAEPTEIPTQLLDLDVVLHRDRLEVYTNASDLHCECKETDVRFPMLETCLYLDDIIDNCSCPATDGSSCITDVRVVGAEGVVRLTGNSSDPIEGGIAGLSKPVLHVDGCSPETLEVPLVWSPIEKPTLTARYRTHHIEAAWSATAPIALVEGGWALAGSRCVTARTMQTLPTPIFWPTYLWTHLSLLQPAQVISTDDATVRIWSASDTVGRSFSPCREDDTFCWLGDDVSVH